MKIKNITVIIIILILFAWSPWITRDYAERKVTQEFTSSWEGIIDGCGFNCKGCGVKDSQKKLFGYSVAIEYSCGLSLLKNSKSHKKREVFVSFLTTVHGL